MPADPPVDELLELTSLPTAPGQEQAVVQWIEAWARRRRNVRLRRDRHGNLMLQREGARGRKPIVFSAHMDHPAFVVTGFKNGQPTAEFRGGVNSAYLEGSRVRIGQGSPGQPSGVPATVRQVQVARNGEQRATLELDKTDDLEVVQKFDPAPWHLPKARFRGDRLIAPVCDDLVGLAAALHSFDQLRRSRSSSSADVRVLLTRGEEVGFIGAMAACRSGFVPKQARIILMENSRSFTESPVGGGPIVRVGDKTSIFDPDLTYRLGAIAQQLADRDSAFQYQRKLMPGGTCEATAYHTLGYAAACLCLPLGNYHNMNEQTGRIDSETISLTDYRHLVRWLVTIGRGLDNPKQTPGLQQRLDQLFEKRRHLLG
jgi:endoglucanase